MSPVGQRVVAIGDLNGSSQVLLKILHGLHLIDKSDNWRAEGTHLIQVGDIFNRGDSARASLELLLKLQAQAPSRKSRVTVLLGNHEVMTTLGNEAYCSVEEYLAFATRAQRDAWSKKVTKAMWRIYGDHPPGGPIPPLGPRVNAWKAENAPGKAAMRRSLGPRGKLGRQIRALPIAVIARGCVFSHAPITPRWARLGTSGVNAAGAEAWRLAPSFYRDLPARGIFRDAKGPLWNRELVTSAAVRVRRQFESSLKHLGATRMVVGHTMTRHIQGGEAGRISLRQGGKLVCIDVGLGRGDPSPCTALVLDTGGGHEWTPSGTRVLWRAKKGRH